MLRSWLCAARYSFLTAWTTFAISPRSFDSAMSMADLILMMSGCRSPSFSPRPASWRCRLASSDFCCWMKPFDRIAGMVSRSAGLSSMAAICR